jgi:hypothetical protein
MLASSAYFQLRGHLRYNASVGAGKGLVGKLAGEFSMDMLAEIRAAFPVTPYPGNYLLSDCWCEECAWEVRNLRGKSWKELTLDDIGEEGARMSERAFRYYLPALLCLAVQHPDSWTGSKIVDRFVVSDQAAPAAKERLAMLIRQFSARERRALVQFFKWSGDQAQEPAIRIESAIAAAYGEIEPYSHAKLLQLIREKSSGRRRRQLR